MRISEYQNIRLSEYMRVYENIYMYGNITPGWRAPSMEKERQWE